MRPLGEISRAALAAAWELAVQRASQQAPTPTGATTGATRLDLEAQLMRRGVGRGVARSTVRNLAQAGHLQPVGRVTVQGRALTVFAPAQLVRQGMGDAQHALGSVLQRWGKA